MFYAGNTSRRSRTNAGSGKAKKESEWDSCPECGQMLKAQNLTSHIARVHEYKVLRRRRPSRQKKKVMTIVALLVISIILGSSVYILKDHKSSDDTPRPFDANWLEGYKPKYSFGSEEDAWWIWHPEQHPDAGTTVNHTEWVLDSLEEKPVVILDHSNNCQPCIQQEKDIYKVLEQLGENITYFNLLSGGSDERANETFDVYDPNEGQSYIPLTVVITLIQDTNNNVRVGWHSIEDATGKDWIEDYMKDAIYYHKINVENWEKNQ